MRTIGKTVCFLSYSWRDRDSPLIRMLIGRLRRHRGIELWIDRERIQVGAPLYSWIERGLEEECDLVIPVVSEAYLSSANCMMELKHAVVLYRNSSKPILPVLLGCTNFPMILEDLVWVDFRNTYSPISGIDRSKFDTSVKALVRSIRYHSEESEILMRARQIVSMGRIDEFLLYVLDREFERTSKWLPLYYKVCELEKLEVPGERFSRHLSRSMEFGFIEGSGKPVTFSYRGHEVEGVPEFIRLTKQYCEYRNSQLCGP